MYLQAQRMKISDNAAQGKIQFCPMIWNEFSAIKLWKYFGMAKQ